MNNRITNRNPFLLRFLPKVLGIISERGEVLPEYGGQRIARVGPDVLLGGAQFDASRIALSIYAPIKLRTVKVFSAHLTDQPALHDTRFYRYLNGQFGLMTWKRGDSWERVILAEQAIPLTIERAFAEKVFPMVYLQLGTLPGPTRSVH